LTIKEPGQLELSHDIAICLYYQIALSTALGSEYSIKASFVNPEINGRAGTYNLIGGGISNIFSINCAPGGEAGIVSDGAILTYIITK
jgi:hypothetical protein